ncbi:MAG: hypothetical protein K6D94_13510 [Clostridiales bacterium]|nr:hypothetical protein [Clostridiales bacterium]
MDLFFSDISETLYIVIWSLFIGVIIGVGMGIYQKGILGSFVRHLLEKRATSPDTALTMDESGLTKNVLVRAIIRRSIRGESSYGRIVSPAPVDLTAPADSGVKPPITADTRFYIPPEMNDRAVTSFANSGNIIVWALLSVAAFLVVALLSFYIVPALTDMLKNIIG